MAAQGLGDFIRGIAPRSGRWLLGLTIVILCASLGIQLHSFRNFLAQGTAQVSSSNVEVAKRAPKPRVTGTEIAAWDLFGVALDEGTGVADQDVDELPETNLRFVLRGTFAAEDPKNASAIIEGPDSKVEFFTVGDSMPGNVTLHTVYPDRVVLSRAGRLETLFFPKVEGMPGSVGMRTASTAQRIEQRKREIMQQQLEQIRNKLKLRQQGQQQ